MITNLTLEISLIFNFFFLNVFIIWYTVY